MSVIVETTLGDFTIDLYMKERPKACLNFLKLCKIKYYNYNLFHTVNSGFIAQTGDPTGSRTGGESIFGVLEGPLKRYFEPETQPRIKHTEMGLVSFVGDDKCMIGSQFFITLAPDLSYLDNRHCVFGEVVEGFEMLEKLNEAICDNDHRPYQDIRITHTVILDDPFPDPQKLRIPERSPSPSAERLQGGRIAPDEDINEFDGKTFEEIEEMNAEREAKARATILEMVGDIPDAEMAPPENVLFVCKLNPVTTDDDLEIIFSRFGKINSCEVIRDRKTGDSLQYAFIEFDEKKSCEDAYFKMDNVLIDDRRIHVDFSQSVAKVKWLGKGRGVTHYDDEGRKTTDTKNNTGKGNYKRTQSFNENRHSRNTEKATSKSQIQSISSERKSRNSPSWRYRRSRSHEKYRKEKRNGNYRSEERRVKDEVIDKHYSKEREKSSSKNYRHYNRDYHSERNISGDKRNYDIKKRPKYELSGGRSKEYKYENKLYIKGNSEGKYYKKRNDLEEKMVFKKSYKQSNSSESNDDQECEEQFKHNKKAKRKHRKDNDSNDDAEENKSKHTKTKKRKIATSNGSENENKKRRVKKSKKNTKNTSSSETSRKKIKRNLKNKRTKRTNSSSSSSSSSSDSTSSTSSRSSSSSRSS
ncbi:peptidyl-prolyl cis-trans isomerase sig-7 [Agrilus planipennis]|uniref:Peptidyl-prolyl cis-trans isomerase n=1 Tax=Agrilus planipennis TaxID=224129 RepID=A0A1W4WK20_AGRPL|nr:peptidyl-prolyl cis-trans isomerase sig-7 [Agrilus planipennis]